MILRKKIAIMFFVTLCIFVLLPHSAIYSQGFEGYYRYPDLHRNTIIFSAEGDLWSVPLEGGLAKRLTTHAEEELFPKISPDGKTIAFSASYEGPAEVYTMPIDGGLPFRWTYESDYSVVNCWTPDGKIVYDTRAFSTLPNRQLVSINTLTKEKVRIPLSQASEACYNATGTTVFFVRPQFHGNVTKRYMGGTARQIWKFTEGETEAVKLTKDYAGESHHPMWWNNRIYFITDRDGIMNIWSMDENGNDLKQHTKHTDFDIRYASLSEENIVYQLGADIWHFNIQNNSDTKVNIKLITDLDQLREKWEDNPSKYITSVEPDKEGNRIAITARGRIFIFPAKEGRPVEFTDKQNVRFRDAVFSSDGKNIITLSDESGEFEFTYLPADGTAKGKQITSDGKILRYKGVPSPDGKWLAYDDLANDLYLLNLTSGASKKISTNQEGIGSFSWSPDSKWIAFVQSAENTMTQIFIYGLESGNSFPVTTDRANSNSPEWSTDGKFIYFLSDRNFNSLVGSPWGTRQPEPFFDAQDKLYILPLKKGIRSPFRPKDELFEDIKEEKENPQSKDKKSKSEKETKKESDNQTVKVIIDKDGILERIDEVAIKPGNYRNLRVNDKAIYMMQSETGVDAKSNLVAVKIGNTDIKTEIVVDDIEGFDLTADGKKLMVRKKKNYYMIDAGTGKESNLDKGKIDLSNWRFAIVPAQDWKQIFTDAWRMERDYFYDKNMHGVNWKAMYDKYLPLVSRVTTRNELSDLIGRFVGELSVLHTSVGGGDIREDVLDISVASLGAIFSRDEQAGGFKIEHIYKADPDYPDEKSPLDASWLDIKNGDIITKVNGKPSLSAIDIGDLVRNQAGRQVRITIKRGTEENDAIIVPLKGDYDLRYRDWEYSRRLEVESKTSSKVGYVHLQAMGSSDLNQWYREFYPIFNRQGLIIDVRHNRGGNIESFILEKLLRKAWMYWSLRTGNPTWNMQYAFRGHVVILVDELTASDGEAFAEGFKRLGLGTSIGMRTWGGEVWLSGNNRLSDNGVARAPMMGVYGAEGKWLIEGRGFEPDIEVDNLPHATFNGNDAQLQTAIDFLLKKIKDDPREVPPVPQFPDKSFNNK